MAYRFRSSVFASARNIVLIEGLGTPLASYCQNFEYINSDFRIEIQPAAVKGEGRVPAFIYIHRGGPNTSLITDSAGNPKLYAYPGSRRLDADLILDWINN